MEKIKYSFTMFILLRIDITEQSSEKALATEHIALIFIRMSDLAYRTRDKTMRFTAQLWISKTFVVKENFFTILICKVHSCDVFFVQYWQCLKIIMMTEGSAIDYVEISRLWYMKLIVYTFTYKLELLPIIVSFVDI